MWTVTLGKARITAAPPSPKNKTRSRGPEMHATCKGNTGISGIKLHIEVEAETGRVHSWATTAHVHDITKEHIVSAIAVSTDCT